MALILLIEDDPLMRRTLRHGLERADHSVVEAEDGQIGLSKFSESRPDLVVTDIVMPNREGVETIQALRGMDPHVPIIAISGGGSVGPDLFLELAQHLGATRTLAKPMRNSELIEAVAECLAPRKAPLRQPSS